MTDDDAFSWWEDKQVAVRVHSSVVRGWVLSCRRAPDLVAPAAGRMTIVVMITDPAAVASYPPTVTVDVRDDGGRGRPNLVGGLWAEDDVVDVHLPHQQRPASRHSPHDHRPGHPARQRELVDGASGR